MGHCVFMLRPDSIYDDNPAEQYQFPSIYLSRAATCEGDWVVYLEPTKVPQSRGYFAIARVQKIIEDPKANGMYLAIIEPGSYLDLAKSVPFRDGPDPIERGLLNEEGRLSGRAQAAIRPISSADFLRILDRGLDQTDEVLPRWESDPHQVQEEQAPFLGKADRQRVEQLVTR
ncbi:MAG: restriction endonuclease, partial [Alphaproteobacteria bacterium]|nr:restriction endonuclease [Alphaproteobacteria bacterium]